MKKYTIAIDIDDTLCNSIRRNFPEDILKVRPRKNIVNELQDLSRKGCTIIIFTGRKSSNNKAKEYTEKWLKKHNIPYDKLIMDKPSYTILIDNRSWNPHQSEFINTKIEQKCRLIEEHIKKHTYRPRRK